MNLEDEVRRALQPLIDQGLVNIIQADASTGNGAEPDPGQHQPITVLVNADDPEPHRVEIMKLVLQAGLKVDLHLKPNASRSRG
jgi:hypothetical protein